MTGSAKQIQTFLAATIWIASSLPLVARGCLKFESELRLRCRLYFIAEKRLSNEFGGTMG